MSTSSARQLLHPVLPERLLPRSTESEASVVRAGLVRGSRILKELDVTTPLLSGQLFRPRTAFGLIPPHLRSGLPDRFWLGCLAIQMVHEASLHHDDVLDGGETRRGEATLLGEKGSGPALLMGDALLTGAYRAAHLVGSDAFMSVFVRSVERTVFGEVLQAKRCHASERARRHAEIIRAKSGELFGAAAALASCFGGHASTRELHAAGVELGAFYQLVDDFLDYCPSADTGKPKLQDFRNRIWTSAAGDVGRAWFDLEPEAAVSAWLGFRNSGPAPAERALETLRQGASDLELRLRSVGSTPSLLLQVRRWLERCTEALRAEKQRASAVGSGVVEIGGIAVSDHVVTTARAVGVPADWGRYFAINSRSFSFAAALFPGHAKRVVQGVYAFCRFTDDLVDEASLPESRLGPALDVWTEICREAYEGRESNIPLVDVVMGDMAERGVPFQLAADLIEGVRMDVTPQRYESMEDLRRYTYRVASVVGVWLTRAFGVHDAWVLDRANALGHAMQLTNILRDVGEDLDMGRVYLPADLMAAHGIGRGSLVAMKDVGLVSDSYVELLEEIMAEADESYRLAFEGLPRLPLFFQLPVAVAAAVYRGIQDSIRSNGHDNLNRRAHTGGFRKFILAAKGIRQLLGARRSYRKAASVAPQPQVRVG